MMQDRDRLGDTDKGGLGMMQEIAEAIRDTLGGEEPDTSREKREKREEREEREAELTIDAIYALVEAVDRLRKVVSESIDRVAVHTT